ncbi:hypothetical protein FB567DRAFT_551807 [Paraphoma chrysanthemicola]|uniref:Ecp2 effector protein domain-containing protein n=1 Tax=Paraphoma chrysanthemicola TaxID=798071 RepID=A0A8K0QZG4_9PLEO|nr:hypothetical protein FB567DRAFT_551807 [Paraphoma chrysanthemicola]
MLFSAFLVSLLLGPSTLVNGFVITGLHKRDVTAQLTVGSSMVPLSRLDGAKFVGDALRKVCSNTGCDSGTTVTTPEYSAQFKTFGDRIGCKWSVTASGNYDSTDERDYMIALLTTSLTATAKVETITISKEDNPLCDHQGRPGCVNEKIEITSGVNFQQVVLNLDGGANKGQLDYRLGVQCKKSGGFDCPSAISGNLKDALSGVPGVGLIIAQIFDISCAA